MMQRDYYPERSIAGASVALREVIYRVFFWMAFGLGVTALVAMTIASSESLTETFVENRGLFFIVLLAQLGIV
ncbi:MAG: hypothetical protein ACRDJE_03510, partial [Dehalococcoidia bacterium]